jgi:hypothetical protein
MLGKPESRPAGAVILRSVWQYSGKHDGRKKSRMCWDGSVLRYKSLKYVEQCYAACISQTDIIIFFVHAVIRGWVIVIRDVVNAYAQTVMPKDELQYMSVDQQMMDWLLERYVIRLPLDIFCCINMSLEGHPCAGK